MCFPEIVAQVLNCLDRVFDAGVKPPCRARFPRKVVGGYVHFSNPIRSQGSIINPRKLVDDPNVRVYSIPVPNGRRCYIFDCKFDSSLGRLIEADFVVASTNKKSNQIGNMTVDMALSPRAYNDNLNGLDNLRVAFTNEKYDVSAEYQHYLTDGESRFSGRANGLLSLVANSLGSSAEYKIGRFAFGGRAFSGVITDEGLLENDPTISSQFEPARLGLANGAAMNAGYKNERFAFKNSATSFEFTYLTGKTVILFLVYARSFAFSKVVTVIVLPSLKYVS